MSDSLAGRLSQTKRDLNLTWKELAKEVGVSERSIYYWRIERVAPIFATKSRLIKALNRMERRERKRLGEINNN